MWYSDRIRERRLRPAAVPGLKPARGCLRSTMAYVMFTAVLLAFAPTAAHAGIRIASPAEDESVHSNVGELAVTVGMDNAQVLFRGYTLQCYIDGQPAGALQTELAFVLPDVDRGTHTLGVRLVNPRGDPVAATATVRFHMWRASKLFPSRKR